jgi:hypothetical protein
MPCRNLIAAIVSAVALLLTLTGARAFDDAKYPDRKGRWIGGWTQHRSWRISCPT